MCPPEMMAIGDSLFNGVRSLGISEPLAQWSAPAQVARALNIPFTTPDYPRNVVSNFEQWLRQFPNILYIAADVESNISFWDSRPKSRFTDFDNIAIASTTYADMYDRTWKVAEAEIISLHGSLGTDFSKIGGNLSALFFAFNTRFLLNPTSDLARPALSPLDIVAERKPSRLLVSIGANNGLWNMGFAAEASSGAIGVPGEKAPFNANDMADLTKFVGKLKELPPEIKHIYWNALPLPSVVADMMPVPDTSDSNKPGPGKYYPVYENRIGFNYATLTATQMAANDATVRAANDRVRNLAAADPRIHIVPIDTLFTQYDFKTNPNADTIPTEDGKLLSNIMLEGPAPFFPSFWRGGLIGLDGMHPTIVGYCLMARAILACIKEYEGIQPVAIPDVNAAYAADSLLQNVPGSWDIVLDLSLDIRRATASGAASPAPTGQKYGTVASILQALQYKYD